MAAKRKTSRRAFLSGQAAIDAIGDLPPAFSDDRNEARPPGSVSQGLADPASYLLQVGRQAMGCEFQVLLNSGQHAGDTEAALAALDLVEVLEQQLSWFRDDSELSRINQTAADQPVPVEPRFFDLLREAVALAEQTGGAFDITAGPLWQLWGFQRREGRLPSQQEIDSALQRVGTRWLQLEEPQRTIRFLRPGIEVNLGAIGKGYALDRSGEVLAKQGITDYLMHGGQSSLLARGSRAGSPAEDPGWSVAVRHPLRPDERLGELRVRDCALGTSGSGNQFFHHRGRRFGHVLDPRSGWPAESVLSATVLASTAARADALATAFLVLGIDATREFVEQHDDLAALLICPAAQTGAMELVTVGMSDDVWRAEEV